MNTDREGAAMPDAELPMHPLTGLRALGLLDDGRPVWPVLGGAEDDDGDVGMDVGDGASSRHAAEEDDDLDDPEGDDEGGDAGKKAEADWKAPTRDDWEKVQKALTESNAEAKKYRLRLREVRAAQRTAEGKAERTGAADDDAVEAARREAREAVAEEYKPGVVRLAASTALVKAEFRNPTDKRLEQMIGRLRMDELDVDFKSGAVDGLEDQIEDLKDNFPELFGKDPEVEVPRQEQRRRTPRINGANKENAAPQPKTTGEIHAARALRGE